MTTATEWMEGNNLSIGSTVKLNHIDSSWDGWDAEMDDLIFLDGMIVGVDLVFDEAVTVEFEYLKGIGEIWSVPHWCLEPSRPTLVIATAMNCPRCGSVTKQVQSKSLFGKDYTCYKCQCGWCG